MRTEKLRSTVVLASLLMCLAFFASPAHAINSTSTVLTSSSNPSVYNQSVTLTATVTSSGGTPTGTVTFKHGSATITENLSGGVATAPLPLFSPGTYAFTATYNGNSNFSASTSNTLNQTVTKATPVITWSDPSAITYGTALSSTQLDATANVAGGMVYNPVAGTILTAGNQTLSVTFTPTDTTDYTTASDNVPLTVNKATPIITWPTPAAITAQEPLSSTQLDASANVGGTMAYSPSSGTLPAGTDTLSVTFTPTDTTDYTTAPDSVQITVFATNTFIVATNGNDSWSGYLSAPNSPTSPTDGPLASPAKAQAKVRAVSPRTSPITVLIRQGTYYLPLSPTGPGTLLFNNIDDSGTSTAQVTWQGYPGDATPIISGGEPANTDPNTWPGATLGLHWNTKNNGLGTVYYATLPANFNNFETLYYNGARRFRSRVHDSGAQTTLASIGYYITPGSNPAACVSTASTPGGSTAQPLANCNLGTYLRVSATIPYSATPPLTCTLANSVTDPSNGATKCLDRFAFAATSSGDTVFNFSNLSSNYNNSGNTPCTTNGLSTPQGDVELYLIDAWTVDFMRINCVYVNPNGTGGIVYLTGPTSGNAAVYNYTGPTLGHRYLIENSVDVFNSAWQTTGQTGIWFLDRSAGATGAWTLNYIANAGETPNTDTIVIPQLGGSIPSGSTYTGASLIYAPAPATGAGLSWVNFSGIHFEVDDFYPSSTGFNNDVNGEYSLPQAIDCESCVSVTFNGVTVSQTSASGILIASPGSTGPAATSDTIEYSVFYDIGSSPIRIGQAPASGDKAANVVNAVSVHDNLIEGYSRVFADGEGIAVGNGNGHTFLNNTIKDGYHAGISVCFNQCIPTDSTSHNNINGNNITAKYNLITDLMQGITSDGGSLYFNVGGSNSSATGDVVESNVVYNTTDSYIIDNATIAKTGGGVVTGSAYGGEGIYLDAQTGYVSVSNNVVYNVDGNAIHLSAGVSWSATNFNHALAPNAFSNNIFAFADAGMLTQQSPWAGEGCPTSGNVTEVTLNENIFNFSKPNGNNGSFQVVTGCSNTCGETYSTYQTFTKNAYYNTNSANPFGSDTNAFQLVENQGASYLSAAPNYSCNSIGSNTYFKLKFGGTACSWQEGSGGPLCTDTASHQVALPVTMLEDVSGEVYNSGFLGTGLSTDPPTDYSFSLNHLTGPSTGFNTSLTDDAITNAGRCTNNPPPPPQVCLPDPFQSSAVPPTLPNYSYTTFY